MKRLIAMAEEVADYSSKPLLTGSRAVSEELLLDLSVLVVAVV